MTDIAKYSTEELLLGCYGTIVLFTILFIPMFYLTGYIFEEHRTKVYRIYNIYIKTVYILIGGFIIWMILLK